jgi:hypothetical protein
MKFIGWRLNNLKFEKKEIDPNYYKELEDFKLNIKKKDAVLFNGLDSYIEDAVSD